jgi:lipopolysaccharide biosynthesis glycosyltransferase
VGFERGQDDPVVIATGANEPFAMPMAVTLYSALVNLEPCRGARIFILDGDITPASKRKVEAVVERTGRDVELSWVKAELAELGNLAVTRWHASICYLRLRLPDLLPRDVDRLIYVDSDVVVEGDLARLWWEPMDGHTALAVANFDPCRLGEALPEPVRALGLDPELPYCNTGVMVVDIPRWREHRMLDRVVEFSRQFGRFIDSADQDGINVAIAGDWGLLDPRWNVQLLTLRSYGGAAAVSDADREALWARLEREAHILHYTGGRKPWHHVYLRSMGDRFLHYLGESGWMGAALFLPYAMSRRATWQGITTARQLRNSARRAFSAES